jgi:hypothetical protein
MYISHKQLTHTHTHTEVDLDAHSLQISILSDKLKIVRPMFSLMEKRQEMLTEMQVTECICVCVNALCACVIQM